MPEPKILTCPKIQEEIREFSLGNSKKSLTYVYGGTTAFNVCRIVNHLDEIVTLQNSIRFLCNKPSFKYFPIIANYMAPWNANGKFSIAACLLKMNSKVSHNFIVIFIPFESCKKLIADADDFKVIYILSPNLYSGYDLKHALSDTPFSGRIHVVS